MKCLSLSVLSAALAGCGAVVVGSAPQGAQANKFEAVANDLNTRPVAQSHAARVTPWSEASRKFHLSRQDPIYAFDEGKSYFRTIALPASSSGKKIEIRSYYSLDFPTTLFVPALLFLDADQRVLVRNPAPAYQIVNGLGEHLRVTAPIPAKAAFIVIYTTPQRVAERMNFKTYRMSGVTPAPSFEGKDTGFGGFYEGILRLALIDQ